MGQVQEMLRIDLRTVKDRHYLRKTLRYLLNKYGAVVIREELDKLVKQKEAQRPFADKYWINNDTM